MLSVLRRMKVGVRGGYGVAVAPLPGGRKLTVGQTKRPLKMKNKIGRRCATCLDTGHDKGQSR